MTPRWLHTPAADRFVRRPLLTFVQTLVGQLGLSGAGVVTVDLSGFDKALVAAAAAAGSVLFHGVLALLEKPWVPSGPLTVDGGDGE